MSPSKRRTQRNRTAHPSLVTLSYLSLRVSQRLLGVSFGGNGNGVLKVYSMPRNDTDPVDRLIEGLGGNAPERGSLTLKQRGV